MTIGCLLAVLASIGLAPDLMRTTYYVSPQGLDNNRGTSPARPWRTVERVNRARLEPRDRVLFKGGSTFDDETLIPPRSGRTGAPITFGSYGKGRANLARGIWTEESHLVFAGLVIDGAGRASAGIAASARESVRNLVITRSAIRNVGIGVLSPKTSDSGWTISRNEIARTGDSALILLGADAHVSKNTILEAGVDSTIPYNKHGVYAKGPDARIVGNRIAGFADNGISTRYPNATIIDNAIRGGPIGIAYFHDSPAEGTTRIAYNRISDVGRAGIYVDGSVSESFLIANNSIRAQAATGLHIKVVPRLTMANNLVSIASGVAFRVERPTESYDEHHNLWFSTSGAPRLTWDGRSYSLASYRSATGQGRGDKAVDPELGPDLVPGPASPAVDAGTVNVSPLLAYRRICRQRPLHYCGEAPDIGAVERRPALP